MSGDPDIRPEQSEAIGARIREASQTVRAPGPLRARVADERLRARPRRRSLVPVLAGATAALAVALVLVVGGGGSGPSVSDAAGLALAGPTAPAPASSGTGFVDAAQSGIRFPDYRYAWNDVRVVGARRDTLGGRQATTVVYRGAGGTIGYTIVGGGALPWPDGGRKVRSGGTDLRIVRRDGATVVTWRRSGHTCVLASRTAPASQLVRMATWV